MNHRVIHVPMAILLVALLAAPASAVGTVAPNPPNYAAIDRYLAAQIGAAHIPGAALGIVHGTQIAHLYGAGRAVTPRTPFVLGSLSKSFTALAIMQLAQAGKITLDAPVRRYLPWFRLADARASARITIRQLLIQTSGIPTAAGVDPLRGRPATLEAQVRALAAVQGTTPGQSFAYSNANYEALGLVVQTVSGEPYGAYILRHIFAPLGMRRSYVGLAAAQGGGLTQGHILWFGVPQARRAFYRSDFLPAGFLVSSAADMARYLVAQLNDGRYGATSILAPAGIAALHRPEVSEGAPGTDARYGMGWVISTVGGRRILWHDGSTFDTHTFMAIDPRTRWGVVVLYNGTSTLYELLQTLDAIAWNVLGRVDGTPAPGTLEGFYIAFDLVALLVTARQLRTLARGARGRPAAPSRWNLLSRHLSPRIPGRLKTAWRIYTRVVVPAAILLEAPRLFTAPWGALVVTDIGLWLAVFAGLQLLTGLLWLARLHAVRLRVGQERGTPRKKGGNMYAEDRRAEPGAYSHDSPVPGGPVHAVCQANGPHRRRPSV